MLQKINVFMAGLRIFLRFWVVKNDNWILCTLQQNFSVPFLRDELSITFLCKGQGTGSNNYLTSMSYPVVGSPEGQNCVHHNSLLV